MSSILGLKQRRDGKPRATWDICSLPAFLKAFESSLGLFFESSAAQLTEKILLPMLTVSGNCQKPET